MANEIALQNSRDIVVDSEQETDDFVTFRIDQQLFGVPILRVRDILHLEKIAFIPLAPPQVSGSINLRGQIVTVIDVRVLLGVSTQSIRLKGEDMDDHIGVTIEKGSDLYTLLVDEISDVLSLPENQKEPVPGTLNEAWRDYATSIYRLKDELVVILDPDRLAEHNLKTQLDF